MKQFWNVVFGQNTKVHVTPLVAAFVLSGFSLEDPRLIPIVTALLLFSLVSSTTIQPLFPLPTWWRYLRIAASAVSALVVALTVALYFLNA